MAVPSDKRADLRDRAWSPVGSRTPDDQTVHVVLDTDWVMQEHEVTASLRHSGQPFVPV